jgi:precorrin-2 dehydrogenase / sirohydrochlorin ferrochelatase
VKDKKQASKALSSDTASVYYSAFLNLKKKKTVVVGGGKVAERKIRSLINTGAHITVISPDITKRIEKEKEKGRIRHISRQYRRGDLKDSFLVIAATDSRVVNEKVSQDSPCLVNVVDTPELCNFIVPSVINRGPLTIAISTGGISPALSRSIRQELEKIYGHEISDYLKLLKKIRSEAIKNMKDQKKRGTFLKAVASEKMLRMLRENGCTVTKRAAKTLFNKAKVTG